MNSKLVHFEKYSVAPSPSRNYYGIKVLSDEVILYLWKVSHGPHLLPIIKKSKLDNLHKDKLLKDEILYAFGSDVVKYVELIASEGPNTLLTLPQKSIENLIKYLNLEDIAQLLHVSHIANEVFNSNSLWEILYKRLKGSNELSDMERELGKTMGFKKLSKDHLVRNSVMKKAYKSSDDKNRGDQKSSRNPEKLTRSASVSVLKQPGKSPKKKATADGAAKSQKSKTKMPKKSTSECKTFPISSPILDEQGGMKKQLAAGGEGYGSSKTSVGKFLFVNEENESAELHLHKEYIKTAILQSDLSNADLEDIIRKKNLLTLQSPSRVEEVKQQPPRKLESKPSKQKSLLKKKASPKITVDESEESGMSYLMKRYLEASDEVARRFSECDRVTKSSSTQVDMPPEQPAARKSLQSRRMSSLGGAAAASCRVATNATPNVFARLTALRKN